MPTAPTITVTDNEDGTATVAVSGSDAGTTNTAYYAQVNYDPLDGGQWTSGGSSTGDGNIAVTPVPVRNRGGVYLWHVTSDDGSIAVSNVVLNRVSGDSQSVYERILEGAHGVVQAAGLTGINTKDIVLQTVPDVIRNNMIIVAPTDPERMRTGAGQGTNVREDIEYPVTFAHVMVANRDQAAAKRNKNLAWRQDISRLFRRQHLTGVSEVHDAYVTYRNSADATAWYKENQLLGAMVVTFVAREVHTL